MSHPIDFLFSASSSTGLEKMQQQQKQQNPSKSFTSTGFYPISPPPFSKNANLEQNHRTTATVSANYTPRSPAFGGNNAGTSSFHSPSSPPTNGINNNDPSRLNRYEGRRANWLTSSSSPVGDNSESEKTHYQQHHDTRQYEDPSSPSPPPPRSNITSSPPPLSSSSSSSSTVQSSSSTPSATIV